MLTLTRVQVYFVPIRTSYRVLLARNGNRGLSPGSRFAFPGSGDRSRLQGLHPRSAPVTESRPYFRQARIETDPFSFPDRVESENNTGQENLFVSY